MEASKEYAIQVKGLSKAYQVIHSPWKRFQYYVFHRASGAPFFALQDINFEIKKGETFGIIGVNGSGKSTLLQILAGIIPATSGSVSVQGKVSALLELGSGFNPESTGYENIYLNAAILGLGSKEIDERLDEIIEFADIGAFLYEPVKTYSSGMFIRLAFAVAINVAADIIIIDEALAVGDIFFRQKCYEKLNKIKAEGKTIILVSHGMNEVEQFCDRALLLAHGKQIMLDKSSEVVAQYYMMNQENKSQQPVLDGQPNGSELLEQRAEIGYDHTFFQGQWRLTDDRFCDLAQSVEHSSGDAHYLRIGLFDQSGRAKCVFRQGEYAYFYCEIKVDHDIETPCFGVEIINHKNIIIHGKSSFQTNLSVPDRVKAGTTLYSCIKLKLDVEEGEYTFEMGLASLIPYLYRHRKHIPHEELSKDIKIILNRRNVTSFLVQRRDLDILADLSFYGLVDLPSEFDSIILRSKVQ